MNASDAMRLIDAGDDLARIIRTLRDEFGPEDVERETDDLGWIETEQVLKAWSRTKVAVTA